MNTLNYAFNVWATTLLVTPVVFNIIIAIDEIETIAKNGFDTAMVEIFFGVYLMIFLVSSLFSVISVLIFLLLAGFLSVRDGDIYFKKMLLVLATLLGFIPFWTFMEYDMKCLWIVSPWIIVGIGSTFLYDWQPEKD
jgi:hypothetical protein